MQRLSPLQPRSVDEITESKDVHMMSPDFGVKFDRPPDEVVIGHQGEPFHGGRPFGEVHQRAHPAAWTVRPLTGFLGDTSEFDVKVGPSVKYLLGGGALLFQPPLVA
jgi:hypothetical protein